MEAVFTTAFVRWSLAFLLRATCAAQGICISFPSSPARRRRRGLAWVDVFCPPQVCEGSAEMIYEALMAGLAVVTTQNLGSIVTDGESGRIVRVGDVDGLAAALQAYIDDPALLEAHGAGARALRNYAGLERYRDNLAAVVKPLTRGHEAGGMTAGAEGGLRAGG